MSFHRNAKLGLAGRSALVAGDRGRDDAEGGRGRLQRVAGDGAPLVASLVGGERGGAGDTVVSVRSLESAASLAAAASRLSWSRRSASVAAGPAGGRGW